MTYGSSLATNRRLISKCMCVSVEWWTNHDDGPSSKSRGRRGGRLYRKKVTFGFGKHARGMDDAMTYNDLHCWAARKNYIQQPHRLPVFHSGLLPTFPLSTLRLVLFADIGDTSCHGMLVSCTQPLAPYEVKSLERERETTSQNLSLRLEMSNWLHFN